MIGILYKCSICNEVVGIFDNDKGLCRNQCSIFHTRCVSDCLPEYDYTVMCLKCPPLKGDKLKRFQKSNNYQSQIQI